MSVFEGFRKSFELKAEDTAQTIIAPAPTVTGNAVFEAEFTYIERQVFILNMQFQLQLITETQYWAEVTRLGWSREQVETLFKTKGAKMTGHQTIISEGVWSFFKSYLWNIPGFTADLESQVHGLFATGSDFK